MCSGAWVCRCLLTFYQSLHCLSQHYRAKRWKNIMLMWKNSILTLYVCTCLQKSQITVSFDTHLGPIVQREDNSIKWIVLSSRKWFIQWLMVSTLWTSGACILTYWVYKQSRLEKTLLFNTVEWYSFHLVCVHVSTIYFLKFLFKDASDLT